MMRLWPLVFLLLAAPSWAAEHSWQLSADQWYRPRSGERVVSIPPVRQALQAWLQQPSSRLVIRYAGGEEGTVWAQELADWLVACGVPSHTIELAPGYPHSDAVEILLRSSEESR